MNNQLRTRIYSTFQLNGLTLRNNACDYLTATLGDLNVEEHEEWLDNIIDHVQKQRINGTAIEKVHVETAIMDTCKIEIEGDEDLLNVISAFDVPKFYYHRDKKKFILNTTKSELYENADSKANLFRNRYELLYQRTLRNKLFSNVSLTENQFKLYPVEYLLSSSRKIKNVVLLGMITELKEGKYFLEDPTGCVQLDLSKATYHDGLFVDNCFVLAEGSYSEKILTINVLGQPPRENPEISRTYFGNMNYFGGSSKFSVKNNERLKKLEVTRSDAMFVIISDLWLDNPKVLSKLKILFEGYLESPPICFVLMGNFLSCHRGTKHNSELKDCFKTLAELLSQFPQIAQTSNFVIIPGPSDSPSANILPRGPLHEIIISDLKSVAKYLHVTTNPCRIQYCTQEFVVIREDLATKLFRNCMYFPDKKDISWHFAKTIISQAHLAPLPLNICPIYWGFDHALYLYPVPDVVIVGDQQKSFSIDYKNTAVINPGSFSKEDFTFRVYYPATKEVEECQISDST